MVLSSNSGKWLVLLVVTALAFRVAFCALVVGWDRAPVGDETDYFELASNLAAGDGYTIGGHSVASRPPLYPALVSLLYRVTGPNVVLARIVQVLLGGCVVLLVFRVARRYFSPPVAWIGAALTACNPFLIFVSGYLLTENLYTILILFLLLTIPRAEHLSASWTRLVAAGVLLGLGTLARPTMVLLVPWLLFFFLLATGVGWRRWLLRGAVLGTLVVVTLLPWAARNQAVFGKWMFFTSHGGITFYQGNNARVLDTPQYHGGVAPLYALPGGDELGALGILERDNAAWAAGKAFLKENKGKVPLLVARKFARFWRFKSDVGMSGIKSGWWWSQDSFVGKLASSLDVGFAYAVLIIPLFVLGLVVTCRHHRRLVVLYGVVVIHTLTALVFHGSLRMRVPIEPVIAIFAAAAVYRIVLWVRRAQAPQRNSERSPAGT